VSVWLVEAVAQVFSPFHGSHVNDGVENDNDRDDSSNGHDIRPEVNDETTSRNFERYHNGFEDEEVPTA